MILPVTRTSTGKLPPQRSLEVALTTTISATSTTTTTNSLLTATPNSNSSMKAISGPKSTPEEIKEKMEQQLRLQRAAHHQKRALEMQKSSQGNVFNNILSSL